MWQRLGRDLRNEARNKLGSRKVAVAGRSSINLSSFARLKSVFCRQMTKKVWAIDVRNYSFRHQKNLSPPNKDFRCISTTVAA